METWGAQIDALQGNITVRCFCHGGLVRVAFAGEGMHSVESPEGRLGDAWDVGPDEAFPPDDTGMPIADFQKMVFSCISRRPAEYGEYSILSAVIDIYADDWGFWMWPDCLVHAIHIGTPEFVKDEVLAAYPFPYSEVYQLLLDGDMRDAAVARSAARTREEYTTMNIPMESLVYMTRDRELDETLNQLTAAIRAYTAIAPSMNEFATKVTGRPAPGA